LIFCTTQHVQWQTNAIALKLIVEWICSFLDNYRASSGNSLLTFQDNLSVLSSRVMKFKKGQESKKSFLDSWPLKMGLIGCPEMSLRNYHYSLHNNPYERWSHLLHGRSLKWHIMIEWVSEQSFMCDGFDCTAYLQIFKCIKQFKLKLKSKRIPLLQKILTIIKLILPILQTAYFHNIAFIYITRLRVAVNRDYHQGNCVKSCYNIYVFCIYIYIYIYIFHVCALKMFFTFESIYLNIVNLKRNQWNSTVVLSWNWNT